jgi:DNA-binding protein HU-beta
MRKILMQTDLPAAMLPGNREPDKTLQGGKEMTKADLVGSMADSAGVSKAVAEKALNGFISAIGKALKKGDRIALTGFGTFSVSNRKARMGRNPQTGEQIKIKAAKVPKFSAGKSLKETVGGKKK